MCREATAELMKQVLLGLDDAQVALRCRGFLLLTASDLAFLTLRKLL